MTEHLQLPTEWMNDARCKGEDTELFYPNRGETATLAKEICRRCSVLPACLEYATAFQEEHGIWGGTTPNERKRLLGKQAARHARQLP